MRNNRIIAFFTILVNVVWFLSLAGLLLLVAAGILLVVFQPWKEEGALSLSWPGPGLTMEFDVTGGPADTQDYLFAAFSFFTAAVTVALVLFVLHHLRAVMASLRSGIHFQPETGRRLTQMGWFTLAAGLVGGTARTLAAFYISSRVRLDGVSFSVRPGFDWMLLFLAFVLFVLAEVWKQGSTLQEENDLTV